MSESVLLCTVGGSPQPILTAIRERNPDYIFFICSGPDPATRKRGSDTLVDGPPPTIPGYTIPGKLELARDRYEVVLVPADGLGSAYIEIHKAVVKLKRRFPNHALIADYTGGTKSMSAALICAALDFNDVRLQLVTGERTNLQKVALGTEVPVLAGDARIRVSHAIALQLSAWRRFAYRETAMGMDEIRPLPDSPDYGRWGRARALSRAFALWDDFDHTGALRELEPYAAFVTGSYGWMLPTLRLLAHGDGANSEPARLFDLWLNAERRAEQGRFDDAVARWYRLMEWTAQLRLRTELNVDTADFPRELLPPDADAAPARDGKIKIGLWQAWRVVEQRCSGAAKEFVVEHGAGLRDMLDIRNQSILAHGFRPVSRPDWDRLNTWTCESFLPLLRLLAHDAGLRREPQQLPTEPPEFLQIAG